MIFIGIQFGKSKIWKIFKFTDDFPNEVIVTSTDVVDGEIKVPFLLSLDNDLISLCATEKYLGFLLNAFKFILLFQSFGKAGESYRLYAIYGQGSEDAQVKQVSITDGAGKVFK